MKDFIRLFIKYKRSILIIISILIFLIGSSAAQYVINWMDSANLNYTSGISGNSMPATVENMVAKQATTSNVVAYKRTVQGKEIFDYKLNLDLDQIVQSIYDEYDNTSDGRRVLGYIDGDETKKKEYLKNMIRAEMITQYPDLRSVNSQNEELLSNEIQGNIKIYRKISEETSKISNIEKSTITSVELSGIVCFGDELTLGNEKDNYPQELAKSLKKEAYNMGFANESAAEVAVRSGARGYSLRTKGNEVEISEESGAQVELDIYIQGAEIDYSNVFRNGQELECTINGIKGKVVYNGKKYIFTRDMTGEKKTIETDTKVYLTTQNGYNSCVPVIWLGNHNSVINSTDGSRR